MAAAATAGVVVTAWAVTAGAILFPFVAGGGDGGTLPDLLRLTARSRYLAPLIRRTDNGGGGGGGGRRTDT